MILLGLSKVVEGCLLRIVVTAGSDGDETSFDFSEDDGGFEGETDVGVTVSCGDGIEGVRVGFVVKSGGEDTSTDRLDGLNVAEETTRVESDSCVRSVG